MVYFVQIVGMQPAQLVLVGTAMEITILLCEIPTGIVADLYTRRGSYILGIALLGVAYLIMGAVPLFAAALIGHVVWGIGYTFTSGAYNAWLIDEIGQAEAGAAFLRGARAERIGGIAGIFASVVLSSAALQLPILVGAVLHLLVALWLGWRMPETGFQPRPSQARGTLGRMMETFRAGAGIIRRSPALLSLVGCAFFLGLFSETWDRLWQAHLLTTFQIEAVLPMTAVASLAALNIGVDLLMIGATRVVERRIDTRDPARVSRVLLVFISIMVLALVAYGLAPVLAVAIGAFVVFALARGLIGPLYDTWQNQLVPEETSVRATVLSMQSQTDAVGQIGGGPPAALLGNASLRLAFVVSAAMLAPALPLLNRARRAQPITDASPIPGGRANADIFPTTRAEIEERH